MESFYGGKQGISFVIKNKFESVSAMETEFKKGNTYTEVWYGEYCIIDTPNKNDPDNGKIYRRGINYQEENGDAIYVGQIVGPSSGLPWMAVDTLDNVLTQFETDHANVGDEYHRQIAYPTASGIKYDSVASTEGDPPIVTKEFEVDEDNPLDGSLVPGKYIDDEDVVHYNDSIQWTWYNVRMDNEETYPYNKSTVKLGFKIPYTVFELSSKSISPYNSDGEFVYNDIREAEDVTPDADGPHPFYKKLNFGTFAGVQGASIVDIRKLSYANKDNYDVYDFEKDIELKESELFSQAPYYSIAAEPTFNWGTDTHRDIIIGRFVTYTERRNPIPNTDDDADDDMDNSTDDSTNNSTDDGSAYVVTYTGTVGTEQPETVTERHVVSCWIYICDKKDIDSFSFDHETGVITATYSDSSTQNINDPLENIVSMHIDEATNHLYILVSPIKEATEPDPEDPQSTIPTEVPDGNYDYVPYSYNEKEYWFRDMGAIKADSGIFIGKNYYPNNPNNSNDDEKLPNPNYNSEDETSPEFIPELAPNSDIIAALNEEWPHGLGREFNQQYDKTDPNSKMFNITNGDLVGKLVTFNDADNDKRIYAFDYSIESIDETTGEPSFRGWYFLGNLAKDESILIGSDPDDIRVPFGNLSSRGVYVVMSQVADGLELGEWWGENYTDTAIWQLPAQETSQP